MTDPLGLIPTQGLTPGQGVSMERAQKPVEGPGFKQVLMQNIQEVNRLQAEAETAITDLQTGARNDPGSVMIAKQKADIAFEMLLQVRNKLMDAYEEVKQIRV
ncbi:MAG: flagellar hook-basal body complex protein FliE [Phycisphaeraceae bacterium]